MKIVNQAKELEEAMISTKQLYNNYINYCNQLEEPDLQVLVDDPSGNCIRPLTAEEFEFAIETNHKFRSDWGPCSDNQWIQYLLQNREDMGDNKQHWASLTQEQALFIKNLRVVEKHSWRSVARNFVIEYDVQDNVSQMMGVMLCEAARKVLNESLEDGWN